MGACCGGMKTSHQHKSLPEKNKAAAAAEAAANEKQLNNDAVVANTTTSGVEGEESQPHMNNVEEQPEVAATTTSLEASPPGPLKQNGSHPEVLHGNHVDADQQQPDEQHIEEPDLLVAVKAATISAEAPTAVVEEPEVAVNEEPVLAAATSAEQVASEPPVTGDDVANEQVRIETIQLRISEDGDLERPAAAEISAVKEEDSVHEIQNDTEITTTVGEAAPVVPELTPKTPEIVETSTNQEDVDVAVVDEEIRPSVEEGVEAAVPYQPETVNIEEATAYETSPELSAVQTANGVMEVPTDKATDDVSAPAPETDVQVETSPVISEVEQNSDVVTAISTVSELDVSLDSSVREVSTVSESVAPEPETVHIEETPVVETSPEIEAEPTTVDTIDKEPQAVPLEEEVPAALSEKVPEEPVAPPPASIDVAVVEEEQPTSLVTDESTEPVPSEQEPQFPANVDSEPQAQEEELPVETTATAEVPELVEATSPVEAKETETETEESAKPVSEDSVAVTAAPEAEVDAYISQVIDENQQQSPVEELVVHTEAVLDNASEVPASEATLQSVQISAEEEVTESANVGEIEQRLPEPNSPEQPEAAVEEIPASAEVASDDNALLAPVDQAEAIQPDAETAAHESEESHTQVDSVQLEVSGTQETTTTTEQPVSSDDATDQSLPPPPPADTEVVPASGEPEQQPASPHVVDGDDALPPPPPPEELSIDQQETPAVEQQQEPALPAAVADDADETTAFADSGVSLTVSSPDDSTVTSPTSEEASSTTAVNASESESGEITSSATFPPSQETPALSEA